MLLQIFPLFDIMNYQYPKSGENQFMKKIGICNLKPLYITLAVILGVVLVVVCFDFLSRSELVVPAGACKDVFGCTEEEFFDKEFDFYNKVGDFRKTSRINKQGDLVLRLTLTQANTLCLYLQEEVHNAEEEYNISVSDDYSTITIYGYKETVYKDAVKAMSIGQKAITIRTLKGKDYLCNYVIKDGATGKDLWIDGVNSPDEFDYIVRNYNFSSITEKDQSTQ